MKQALFGAFANLFKPEVGSKSSDGLSLVRLKIELLSGLTVALALVPEAVAFAFVAGVLRLLLLLVCLLSLSECTKDNRESIIFLHYYTTVAVCLCVNIPYKI